MAEFDPAALRDYLESASVAVVVAERHQGQHPYRGYSLDLSEDLQADFRDRAIANLGDYEGSLLPVPYSENTLLSDEEYAVTDRSVLDPQLLDEILRAAAVSPDVDHPPTPDQLRLYAVVAQGSGHEALLIRRQNPVRHLARGVLTLQLSRSRLNRADPVFVYDADFDLVVFDDGVAIRSQPAFDAMFRDDAQRTEETQRALESMARFIEPSDSARLAAAAAADSRYAAKLRRSLLAGVFEAVDLDAVRATISDFGLELQMGAGGVAFPRGRAARWELIYALEDAFVEGRATGRRYRANSKRPWQRRSVDQVRVQGSRVTTILGPGEWSPRSASDALGDLDTRKEIEYVARLADEPALIEVHGHGDQRQLWVSSEDRLTNRLLELVR